MTCPEQGHCGQVGAVSSEHSDRVPGNMACPRTRVEAYGHSCPPGSGWGHGPACRPQRDKPKQVLPQEAELQTRLRAGAQLRGLWVPRGPELHLQIHLWEWSLWLAQAGCRAGTGLWAT